MAKLSIIIPFGTSKERPYIKERVIEKAQHYVSNESVEYIFVEGFSSIEHPELKILIENQGHRYIKDEIQQASKVFSTGQCRNLGVINAKSDVVMSLDVDCVISEKNLENILELISIKEIDKNPNAFLVLPCVFLNELGTEILQNRKLSLWDNIIKQDLLFDKKFIKFLTPASSTIVMNRFKFLELGGNDKEFIGHGYEDFDLMMRILKNCATFEALPNNLDFDYRNWNFNDFKGFRALFSIVGNEAAVYGIYLYHLWHIEPNQNGYFNNRDSNHKKFFKNLSKKNHFIESLQENSVKNKKNLALFQENSTSHRILNQISVFIGECIFKLEGDFFDYYENEPKLNKKAFLIFLKNNEISNIILFNPYDNELRLKNLSILQRAKFPI
ncbi:galactosyltransferase-related protein [Campylobacter estrildidarum]|uniref:galactosyltransferase-related protein n=1 Tax=Campylobacter estrildidarum TaxID=2510189 RepID=UPI001485BFF2|nr:galactosyltransferase-related protein [Campylobacter estrildidarum]